MQIVENKKTNLAFVISIAVMLSGLVFYLIHEFVYVINLSTLPSAYRAFVGIADFIGMAALIVIILALFLPKIEKLFWTLAIILGSGYVFFYLFGHFMAVQGVTGSDLLARYSSVGLSFFGLLLICCFSILMIVVFVMRFKKTEEFAIYEKFSIILWLTFIGIFDFLTIYLIRLGSFGAVLGITFLPSTIEMIYLLFGTILLTLSFFIGVKKNILSLLVLLLANVIAITYAIGTVSATGFPFFRINTALIIGNFLVLFGAVALVVSTFFILKIKYEKPMATAK
ncbi:MAG: hypothetical protein JXA54_12880 [Candidatus Heimdallarchaeota archaeon]|nr:hypothetical protein [Candidatus Heimdallarchaeota archaeon]